MQCIDAPDLEKVLEEVPRDRIRPLIAQLAAAAKFLDDLGLAHLDIKPSNIAVSRDFQKLTLLDLGVLRPFGEAGLTDIDGHPFIGTLQYSSPEFLFRTEVDDPDGWRALAFYQIGAVLHDLLTRRKIFEEHSTPYARLVEAVKYAEPELKVPGADADLVALAGSCLAKNPATRLRLVTWASFSATPPKVTVASVKERVLKRQAAIAAPAADPQPAVNLRRALSDLVSRATGIIRDESAENSDVFPPVEVHDHPPPDGSSAAFRAAFPKTPSKGISHAFALLFRITVLDTAANLVEIVVSAAVSGNVRRFPPNVFGPEQKVYSGPFGEELVKNRIRLVLYASMEAAMGDAPANPDEARALTIEIPDELE
jgi:serine/threonine protein kinase